MSNNFGPADQDGKPENHIPLGGADDNERAGHRDRVYKLLKRAVIHKHNEVKALKFAMWSEGSSDLPAFYETGELLSEAGNTQNFLAHLPSKAFAVVASGAALFLLKVLLTQKTSKEKELKQALGIWSEMEHDIKGGLSKNDAIDIAEEKIRRVGGINFEGIPEENLSGFKKKTYHALAQSYGVSADKTKNGLSLGKVYEATQQLKNIKKKHLSLTTQKNLGKITQPIRFTARLIKESALNYGRFKETFNEAKKGFEAVKHKSENRPSQDHHQLSYYNDEKRNTVAPQYWENVVTAKASVLEHKKQYKDLKKALRVQTLFFAAQGAQSLINLYKVSKGLTEGDVQLHDLFGLAGGAYSIGAVQEPLRVLASETVETHAALEGNRAHFIDHCELLKNEVENSNPPRNKFEHAPA